MQFKIYRQLKIEIKINKNKNNSNNNKINCKTPRNHFKSLEVN